MSSDNRLSRMLHVLIHMDQREQPLTSDEIARMLNTNPVVVRRTMAGLRLRIDEAKGETSKSGRAAPKFSPAGQSTQMIVGATPTPYGGKWSHEHARHSATIAGASVVNDIVVSEPAVDGDPLDDPAAVARLVGALSSLVEHEAASTAA